jgi:hypothetical protein
MGLFKRKKERPDSSGSGPRCSYCGSNHTRIIPLPGAGEPDFIKTWRGQRYLTCRCLDCGQDFYADAPAGISLEEINGDEAVDDPEALREAEDELRREMEDDDDRTCR